MFRVIVKIDKKVISHNMRIESCEALFIVMNYNFIIGILQNEEMTHQRDNVYLRMVTASLSWVDKKLSDPFFNCMFKGSVSYWTSSCSHHQIFFCLVGVVDEQYCSCRKD